MSKKFFELQPNDEVAESADLSNLTPASIDLVSWQDLTIQDGEENIADKIANDDAHIKSDGVASAFAETTYAAGDFCTYDGKAYVCKLGYTATAASPDPGNDTTHWQIANLPTLFSGGNASLMGVVRYTNEAKSGSDMAATTAYAISTAYAVGDYILHDSTNYVCITAVTAAANTDWDTVSSSFAARTAKTAQMADRTTNAVTVTNATMNITFPAAVTDKMRDFLVYIDATGYAAGGKFTVTLPTGATQYGDDFPAITATGEYLVAITEIAAGKFYVRAIELEEVE